jgi:capsular exopolysaccharide synthesis family protein
MSRLTEALRRANETAAVAPVDSHPAFDSFPVEAETESVRPAVPVSPIVPLPPPSGPVGPAAFPVDDAPAAHETATLTIRGDSTGRRVQTDTGRRIQTDPSGRRMQTEHGGGDIQEPGGPAGPGPDAQLAVFTEYNKKLVERLVVPNGAPHMMIEEYRKLAAALHHAQLAHGTKVIMVTSASPGEGKTLTASNLALTLSQSYQRHVLLIDADLRKPTVHEVFAVENAAGLIDALREAPDKTDRHVPLVQVSSRLELLLSGGVTPDPMSLLTSETLRGLLKDAAEAFDWVIVDTPPAAFLPDCNLMSSAVDAALIVVRAFVTPYPLVQRVVESVGHEKVLGVVLNHAEQSPSSGYYGYGYGYGGYGYYGGGIAPPKP